MQDRLLLRQYVKHGSEAAFAEIVNRHLRLVYATSLREVGHTQMAEDVTQGVFLILARKAPSLGRHTPLAAWLFQTARLASKSALRQERRRRMREQQAAQIIDSAPPSGTRELSDDLALNEALAALRAGDREAILLRFFEEMSFAEAGAALGITEDTAQKRVSRAIEKMRAHLTKNGSALSGTALTGILSAEAMRAVPPDCITPLLQIIPGLHVSLGTSSLFGARADHISQGVLRTMKAKTALTTASVSALALVTVSVLLAGGNGLGGSVVGTWITKVPSLQHKRMDMTIRFNPNGTFTSTEWYQTSSPPKIHTLFTSGTYKLTGSSLTTDVTKVTLTLNGKPEPIRAEGLPVKTGVMTFSNDGKTLTLTYSYFKQVLSRQH